MTNKRNLIVEITILSIVFIIIGAFLFTAIKTEFGKRKTYHAVFHDVDGLIPGSPVRIMGVDVGHIKELKNLYDQVHVNFIITKKNVVIPKGTFATVQFTGLAGSKSLELMPLNSMKLKDCPQICTKEPIRINKVFSVQNALTDSLVSYTKSVSDFIGDKTDSDTSDFIKSIIEKTYSINNSIESVKNNLTVKRYRFLNSIENVKSSFQSAINGVDVSGNAANAGKKAFSTLNYFSKFVSESLTNNKLKEAERQSKSFSVKFKEINGKKDIEQNIYEVTEVLDNSLPVSVEIVKDVANKLSDKKLNEVQKKLTQIKEDTKILKEHKILE